MLETAQNLSLAQSKNGLEAILSPRSIAVVGATEKEGSVGRTILWNLISNRFGGVVFPVNPKREAILGIKAYKTLAEIPGELDLAVIVTPAPTVPAIMQECADRGVRGVVIISAGFKEVGAEGQALEDEILKIAKAANIHVVGPNCLGVMMPNYGMNATFGNRIAQPGNVGFISQSGALCTAILDWSFRENIGFSAFISIGSMLDVGWGDLIDYLGNDPRTKSIVIYMESIGNARDFLSAAREVALRKPIIVIKAGRTTEAASAAASHTGTLAGSDKVLDAAFRRTGVLRVDTIAELFYMAEILSKQPRPKGPNLTILSNAGGPAVLATDSLIRNGGKLAKLSDTTMKKLNEILPPQWSHGNPVDILGDAAPERYAKALDIACKDKNSDGILVILTPQAMTDPTRTADALKQYRDIKGKPILASWMGGADVAAGESILSKADIPTFPYPDTAARIFNYMWKYSYNLRGLYETPSLAQDSMKKQKTRDSVSEIIHNVRESGRTLLTEFESKQVLKAYDIPIVATIIAKTVEEAVAAGQEIGYPVVAKLHSETVTHKTDVGGVKLNLANDDAVVAAFKSIQDGVTTIMGKAHFQGVTIQPMIKLEGYEIIVGSSTDPQFGPVMLFGSGGQLVEVYRDRALSLPPLNTTLARRMMEQTKIYEALKGVRGRKSVDLDALEKMLVKFSFLIAEQPWIKEVDINPLLAKPYDPEQKDTQSLVALDARIVLHDLNAREQDLPRLAIRPYPINYAYNWQLRDGENVSIRPIRPEDEPKIVAFHNKLSEETVYFRYFHPVALNQRTAHERLARICFNDYDREIALVVETSKKENEIIAIGRLTRETARENAEFAVIVSDTYQKSGIGTELLQTLVAIAKKEEIKYLHAQILLENRGMQRVCEKLGFALKADYEEQVVHAEIRL